MKIDNDDMDEVLSANKVYEKSGKYVLDALDFDLVQPGDLVRTAKLIIEWNADQNKNQKDPWEKRYRLRQVWVPDNTGIVLSVNMKDFVVSVLSKCKKSLVYYRAVKKLEKK